MSTFRNMPVDFKTRVPTSIPTVMITIVPDAATLKK